MSLNHRMVTAIVKSNFSYERIKRTCKWKHLRLNVSKKTAILKADLVSLWSLQNIDRQWVQYKAWQVWMQRKDKLWIKAQMKLQMAMIFFSTSISANFRFIIDSVEEFQLRISVKSAFGLKKFNKDLRAETFELWTWIELWTWKKNNSITLSWSC